MSGQVGGLEIATELLIIPAADDHGAGLGAEPAEKQLREQLLAGDADDPHQGDRRLAGERQFERRWQLRQRQRGQCQQQRQHGAGSDLDFSPRHWEKPDPQKVGVTPISGCVR